MDGPWFHSFWNLTQMKNQESVSPLGPNEKSVLVPLPPETLHLTNVVEKPMTHKTNFLSHAAVMMCQMSR